MSNFFIILAAGESKRFNSYIPKPYIVYKGKPIIQHSIDKAQKCKKIDKKRAGEGKTDSRCLTIGLFNEIKSCTNNWC